MPKQRLGHDTVMYLMRSCNITWTQHKALLVLWNRIKAIDPQLAADLDHEMGCLVVEAIEEGFVAGYELARNPELVLFAGGFVRE